jgi:hypothetical protein
VPLTSLAFCITNAYLAHIENVVCRNPTKLKNPVTIKRENPVQLKKAVLQLKRK